MPHPNGPYTQLFHGEDHETSTMKITSVRAILLSSLIPSERRWRSDYGVMTKTDDVIVSIETDEGITGIGFTLREDV